MTAEPQRVRRSPKSLWVTFYVVEQGCGVRLSHKLV